MAYKILTDDVLCLTCNKSMKGLTSVTNAVKSGPNKGQRLPRKYCSKSCAAIRNNKEFPKRKRNTGRYCPNCGIELPSYAQVHCSRSCQLEQTQLQRINRWLAGELEAAVSSTETWALSPIIRRYLLEQANHSCQLCGWDKPHPTTGRPPLQIDHIDGNWQNPSRDNLQVLCPNCHALQPTHGSLNAGNNSAPRWKRHYRTEV